MFAAKTDIPCMIMDIPYILYERGAAPLAKEEFNRGFLDVRAHTTHFLK